MNLTFEDKSGFLLDENNPKLRSNEKTLIIRAIDPEKVKSSSGLIDPRLFSNDGDNLKCSMNPQSCLWTFKYSSGILPKALKGSYTTFSKAKDFADKYFEKRGLKIVEVID